MYVLVSANAGGMICGVGMISTAGEIMLNYVHPEKRFLGISRALLTRMEEEARRRDLARCFLESTQTARDFYLDSGYKPVTATNTEMNLVKMC